MTEFDTFELLIRFKGNSNAQVAFLEEASDISPSYLVHLKKQNLTKNFDKIKSHLMCLHCLGDFRITGKPAIRNLEVHSTRRTCIQDQNSWNHVSHSIQRISHPF